MRKFFCLAILAVSMLSLGCMQKTTYMVYYDANNPERIEEPFLLDVKVTGKTRYDEEGSANAIEVGELLRDKIVEKLKKENLYLTDYEQNVNKYMLVVDIKYFIPGSAKERTLSRLPVVGLFMNDKGGSALYVDAYLSGIKKIKKEYVVAGRIAKLPSSDSLSAHDIHKDGFSLLGASIDMASEASEGRGSDVINGTATEIVRIIKKAFVTQK